MIPATIFNENPNLGATIVDFMAILQSIDYSKFERLCFLECEVLVVVPDRQVFKFSMKAAERKPQIEYSTHMQEIEIIAQQTFVGL